MPKLFYCGFDCILGTYFNDNLIRNNNKFIPNTFRKIITLIGNPNSIGTNHQGNQAGLHTIPLPMNPGLQKHSFRTGSKVAKGEQG